MLREMGVQVWLPETPAAQAQPAVKVAAPVADEAPETKAATPLAAVTPAPQTVPVARTPPPAAAPLPARAQGEANGPSWSLGEARPLYAETTLAQGARWLVMAELPAAALMVPVFDGDAGRLLDNMLRAARLHVAGSVLFVPVLRHAAAPPGEEFSVALAALIGQARPDVVLLMGRLASQALLRSTEPLGRLRGRVHALHGARAVVTYDAPYLLRTAADKAKAWDDLRLAMGLAAAS